MDAHGVFGTLPPLIPFPRLPCLFGLTRRCGWAAVPLCLTLAAAVLAGCKSSREKDSFRDEFTGWGQNFRPKSKTSAGPSMGLSSRSARSNAT